MYEKTPRVTLICQLNSNTWLSSMEECKKAFITHINISEQQTHDWTLGGTKQEVQTYATATVLLKPSSSSGNARALLPWKFHNDGDRLLAKKRFSVDGGRGKDHPCWRPAWPEALHKSNLFKRVWWGSLVFSNIIYAIVVPHPQPFYHITSVLSPSHILPLHKCRKKKRPKLHDTALGTKTGFLCKMQTSLRMLQPS